MNVLTDDEAVRFVQTMLRDRGRYHGAVDGKMGPFTQQALVAALGPAPVPSLPADTVVGTPRPEPTRSFDARSLEKLKGVHEDLVAVMTRALTLAPMPFIVIEGLRTLARQKQLVAQGASKTMRSRHLTGHAVDIVPLRPDGQPAFDWPLYHRLAPAVKQAAEEQDVAVEWGGDWTSFKDGPHFQLSWAAYP